MPRHASVIGLSNEQRTCLQDLLRQPKAQARFVERARIILLADEGMSNAQIAQQLKTRRARVSKWRTRFAAEGTDGLWDDFRPGRPIVHDAQENEDPFWRSWINNPLAVFPNGMVPCWPRR